VNKLYLLIAFFIVGKNIYAGNTDRNIVKLTNTLKFIPETLIIYVGDTVIWFNSSDLVHTVTADPEKQKVEGSVILPAKAKAFDSGKLNPGKKFLHVFTEPGLYKYFCKPHEAIKMVGYIRVLERKTEGLREFKGNK